MFLTHTHTPKAKGREVKDMFISVIVVMVSRVYAYLQTHQNVYSKHVWLHLNKAV